MLTTLKIILKSHFCLQRICYNSTPPCKITLNLIFDDIVLSAVINQYLPFFFINPDFFPLDFQSILLDILKDYCDVCVCVGIAINKIFLFFLQGCGEHIEYRKNLKQTNITKSLDYIANQTQGRIRFLCGFDLAISQIKFFPTKYIVRVVMRLYIYLRNRKIKPTLCDTHIRDEFSFFVVMRKKNLFLYTFFFSTDVQKL